MPLFGPTPQPTQRQSKLAGKQLAQKQTTQAHLSVAEIKDGIVILKDGSLRLIMMVSAINFDLKSETEQNALIYAYQNFLNSLNFPIQIVVQSRRLDLSEYLAKLQQQIPKTANDLIRLHIQDYIDFIQKLLKLANIMDKKFYLVIPYFPIIKKPTGFIEKLATATSGKQPVIDLSHFQEQKRELMQRAQVVAQELASLGIRAVQLNTQELIELLYSVYNPELATREKLASPEELQGPVIESQK